MPDIFFIILIIQQKHAIIYWMKKLTVLIVPFLSLLLLFSSFRPVFGMAPLPSPYLVNSFDSQITVEKDTSLTVTETLEVLFNEPRHGIFRIIPVTYSNGLKTINAKLKIITITDETNKPYQYTSQRYNQSLKIQIGDPNLTITGPHSYLIKYNIGKVLLRYKDHDEIYWNVAGSEWDTTIIKATATVSSPFAEIIKVECYSGRVGTKEKYCTSGFEPERAEFSATNSLSAGKDLTIVVGLNKNGSLKFPGPVARAIESAKDNIGYFFALAPLLILTFAWYKKGRDQRYLTDNVYRKPADDRKKTVSLFDRPHLPLVYSPINGLTPSQVGTIIDEKVNTKDVIAEILELARLGFLKIQKIEKKKLLGKGVDYLFTKKDVNTTKLKDYQKYLLEKLFVTGDQVTLSGLKDEFYQYLETLKKKLYKNLQDEDIFAGNPQTARAIWGILYFVLMGACFIPTTVYGAMTGNGGPLLLFFPTIIPAIFLIKNMPKRTAWGYSLFRQVTGLRYFIDKGKWREEIAEKNLFFEEILPLAVALGVVDKLAKEMKDLGAVPPSYLNGFTATAFASDLSRFSSSAAGSLVSSPKSSWSGHSSWSGGSGFSGGGSGSSGGGFGGGGGGSW